MIVLGYHPTSHSPETKGLHFRMEGLKSIYGKQVGTYHIKNDPVCMQVMVECSPFATAVF